MPPARLGERSWKSSNKTGKSGPLVRFFFAVEPPTEFLAVGRILRPHGVRGDMLLETLTDFPEHLSQIDIVYLGEGHEPRKLDGSRVQRRQLIVHLTGYDEPESIEPLRGQLVFIRTEAAAPLPPGAYYQHQLQGLQVVSNEGEVLGEVMEILETGANDVYVVATPNGQLLLPAISSVVLHIDVANKRITVHLLDGLR